MTGPTEGAGEPQVVVFGPRRSSMLWPMAVIYVGMVIAGLVAVASGDPKGWVLIGAGGVLTATRVGLNRMIVRRAGLRIDPVGLTWLDGNYHLAWSDVNSVQVVRAGRLWRFLGFRPEVDLVDHAQARFAERAASTPVVHRIDLRYFQADLDDLIDAMAPYLKH